MYDVEAEKEFIEYFESCNEAGVPVGLSDLVRKARKLNLPIPDEIRLMDDEVEIIWPAED